MPMDTQFDSSFAVLADDPIARFVLARLIRLQTLDQRTDLSPEQRRLVRHCLFGTYLDCRAAGLSNQTLLSAQPFLASNISEVLA